ncbi:MAG: Ig-like domain-containing protein [Bacteroidota bacterium]
MNTPTTNPTTALSRWTHFSRMIRGFLGVMLSAGLTAALLLVIFMVGCKEESPGIVNVCIAPTVIRTSPANGGANVPLNKISDANESAIAAAVKKIAAISKTSGATGSASVATVKVISATFSTPMDPNSLTAATFNVWQGTTPILGAVLYTDTTAIFVVPNGLDPNLTYQCTITTGAKDLAGIALANNYVWIFTTGDAPGITLPTVTSTAPINAATGVPFNQKIAATFSVAMDASTFTSATFILRQGSTSVSGFVSYSGTTAIFAPASPLATNTAYTATITTQAKDLAGNALANNFVWSFTTGTAVVVTPPTVSSTTPVDAATGVPLNQKIAATFSKTMDASTFTSATFILKQGTTSVSGFVSYSGTTAIFAPASNLASNTAYTATITTGVKDLAANALANDFVWSFTTGTAVVVTPPTVSSTDPVNVATGVPLNQKIAATFSKTMDASTIQTSTFRVMQGTTLISGFVSYIGITATFAPASNLLPNSTYIATISTSAKDLAGNALANDFVWSFTTGAAVVITPPAVISTDPLNAAIGVPLNQKVAATFNKTMDPATIHTSTFTLKQGITPVSGFVSYSGVTAIFDPASNLAPNTVYTATVTIEAKDLAGNSIASDYVWNFTTGAVVVVTPPTVISTDPANTATCVALDKHIAATFSKTMDPTTIQTSTFILMQGTTQINGFVFYSGTTATFVPASNLTSNTIYTATMKTSAMDLAGNPMASNYVWSFTTVIPDTVRLSSNPSAGGTTSGGGIFNSCSSVTVAAIPNIGYTFTNWTENGTAVSTNANYLFTLSGNRTLVANFAVIPPTQYTVTLSSIPLAGGTTSGGGSFNSGSSVTATATPNSGYVFTNWTETGSPVSTNASYTFTITGDRTLVANFGLGLAPGAVPLGLASTYGILSSSAITDASGASVIWGDVAMYPGTANGLLPAQVHGAIHIADGVAQSVYTNLTTAYHFAKNLAPGTTVPDGQDLGTFIVGVHAPGHLPPGTYTSSSTLLINTPVVLDGGGDANAVWVFQIGSSLTTYSGAPGGNVTLTGSAQQKNVFFVPTAAASIGSGTTFYGNILAGGDLTSAGGATIYGRLLAGAIGASTLALDGAASTVFVPAP